MNRDWEREFKAEDRKYARIQIVCIILMIAACTAPTWVHYFK